MKKKWLFVLIAIPVLVGAGFLLTAGGSSSDRADREVVEEQQSHYQKIHPVPFYDYSIPRDVLIQIYDVVTTRAYVTYTVIESITGKTFFHGPSIGYGIPCDTSLTNPRKYTYEGGDVDQPEPNGLFSSKNTDGTWVLFVQPDGSVTPIYTEHKVTTFPFAVKSDGAGGWIRADNKPSEFTIEIKK